LLVRGSRNPKASYLAAGADGGGDLLQCKVALLVNIAHSRKFHEPTLE
jgi:hypothetical protein